MKTQQSTMEKCENFIKGLEPEHFENVSFLKLKDIFPRKVKRNDSNFFIVSEAIS